MDIRQSPEYANFIKSLGWTVEKIESGQVFIRKFPLIGSLIKIQRISPPIPFAEIEELAKKYHTFQIVIEPLSADTNYFYKKYNSPFIPTKTLILNLKPSEEEIFYSFSKNKRRDIRIAERNKLIIKEGLPEDFIQLKKQYLLNKRILPIAVGRDIKLLCQAFGKKARILLAYDPKSPRPVAGELLLLGKDVGHYWQAAASDAGKRLLAPTLLLWEAIKLAKKSGCETFDFEGVYDERFPKNKSWQGFTHFKEGFRGKEVIYPQPLVKNKLFFLYLLPI